jgi:hypothetical protein
MSATVCTKYREMCEKKAWVWSYDYGTQFVLTNRQCDFGCDESCSWESQKTL